MKIKNDTKYKSMYILLYLSITKEQNIKCIQFTYALMKTKEISGT